ncbi:cleaved adhesin domain protein [Chryseobacterium sp. StRB126]|uniref:T9SS-dependent choice-of-anchor J family protein n=1 Tax=Chryseobacterium sp. StRB126 TaxID=878220 RepID=UPI0004E99347|nr:T9SS type A sorting domain-containing protein [Chryseobacterium sp. StRB126]BAP31839.1 cleaved adhesin domain protein [Chryseobacterium sp. StRB126]
MKKSLFFTVFVLLSLVFRFNAQTVILEETFDSSTNSALPVGWEAVDRSGTYLTWTVADEDPEVDAMGFSGKTAMVLSSPISDELLVSPVTNLPTGNSFSLTFLIGTFTGGGIFLSQQHYAVYVLPEGDTFTGSETPILEEDITVDDVADSKTVDLSAYAGQSVKIYFRQFNSTGDIGILLLDTIQLTQQSQLGTLEVGLAQELTIYPNPTCDYVVMKTKSKILKAEVFDLAGKKVQVEVTDNKINMQQLPPGAYLLKITTGNKIYSRKIIKK